MSKIIYPPKDVWKLIDDKAPTRITIAKDDEHEIEIVVDLHSICVLHNGEVVRMASPDDAHECERSVLHLYQCYLRDHKDEEDSEEDCDDTPEFCEDEISEREEWLDQAVMDFLEAVIGDDFQMYEPDALGDLVEDCKDHFLEYLARKHSVPVFRPMLLEDEDGNDYYSEYPYEEMEFEDEDNPIYM